MSRPLTKQELSILSTIIFGIFWLLLGFGIASDGIPINTIEIVPTETQVNVYTHTRSTWPPFKSIDYSVKDVKHAVLNSKGSLSSFRYLELETNKGTFFHITGGSSFPSFRQNLHDRLNDAILNRTRSTIVYRELPNLIEGIAFTIVGILTILFGLFWHIKTKRNQKIKEANINDEQKKLLDVLQQHIQQKEQGLDTPRQQNKSKLDQEKYKNINDSIIK